MLSFLLFAAVMAVPQSNRSNVVIPVTTNDSVKFELRLQQGTAALNQITSWYATYKGKRSTARFRIELSPKSKTPSGSIPISSGRGKFQSETDSNNFDLIAALKNVLQAKTVPDKPVRRKYLPFEYMVLGQEIHRAQDGSVDSHIKGDWIILKLFFGDDEGEVFLYLNPVAGAGEFAIKDPDYGNYVVRKLAEVL